MDGAGKVPGIGNPTRNCENLGVFDWVAEWWFLMSNEEVEVVDSMSKMATDDVVELEMTN